MTDCRKSNIVEIENLRNENGALRRAVDSKSAAIAILRTELEECQRERDEFRMMAETHSRKQPVHPQKIISPCPEKLHSVILGGSENTLAQLLSQSKEENKQQRQELTELRCRLHDACSDLKILRTEKCRKTDSQQNRLSIATSSHLAQQERENYIQQLEHLSSKCQAQENDIRCLLEEREELNKERDDTRHKLHRLNYILNLLLSRQYSSNRPQHRMVDLDAIITENRYLQQRMKHLDEERSVAVSILSKYKSALESCRTNINSRKFRASDNLIMSPKQVSDFLRQYEGELGESGEKNLKFICIALVDALNQKSRAVKTHKAANKMLIERIADLERRLVAGGDSEKDSSAGVKNETNLISASLMDGYNPSTATNHPEYNISNVLEVLENQLKENDRTKDGNIPSPSLVEMQCSSSLDTPQGEEIEESSLLNDADQANSQSCVKEESSEDAQFATPVQSSPAKSIQSSSSDSEEIVPIENLDLYISNLKMKRSCKRKTQPQGNVPAPFPIAVKHPDPEAQGEQLQEAATSTFSNKVSSGNSSDVSFDIDISDYDSDDGNLEVTLQNWQSECEKTSCNKIIARLSPKKSVPSLLKSKKKWNRNSVELPDTLKEILK